MAKEKTRTDGPPRFVIKSNSGSGKVCSFGINRCSVNDLSDKINEGIAAAEKEGITIKMVRANISCY